MIRFGTGGWRAVIGDDFVRENIRRVAQGVYALMVEQGKTGKPVIIGYDRRFISNKAAEWIAEVLAGNGVQVLFLRRSAPTPLIMHTVKKRGLDFGMEVTASHNPAEYNGIKLIVEEGRDAPLETTGHLETLIDRLDEGDIRSVPFAEACATGKVAYIQNPFNDFLDDILAVMDTDAIRARGLRILFDPMHGSGTYPLLVLLFTARCTVDLINSNKDAYFGGGMPAPSAHGLSDLTDKVVAGGYDLGIAIDGDGDRLGIIDANGRYIDANEILCLLYYYLHEHKGWKGPVVRNLATTHMLDAIAESFGETCYEVPVGFKYISAKIDEVDAVLGGESSGGLTVRGHINGKDSIYAAVLFVEMLSVLGRSASELIDGLRERYGRYDMVETNLRFPADRREAIRRRVMEREDIGYPDFGTEVVRVNLEDGCKLYFADGSFVICRFSGTEPLLRIFAEASSAETAQRYIGVWRSELGL